MMQARLLGLMAASAVLASMISWEAGMVGSTSQSLEPRQTGQGLAGGRPGMPEDRADVWRQAILARPLFSPDRRPAPAEGSSASGPVMAGLPHLSGIIIGPFERSAIFAPEGGKPVVVSEGGKVDSWLVEKVSADEVRLNGAGGHHVLRPGFGKEAPAAMTQDVAVPRVGRLSSRQ